MFERYDYPTLSKYPPPSQCFLQFPSGFKLSVGRKLAVLLLVIQKTLAGKYLCIDAVCINQEDLEERSKEVTRMRDIYQAASDVLVWLGPEENDSELALSLIARIAHQNFTTNPSFMDMNENPEGPKWPPEDREWAEENIRNGDHLSEWQAFNSLLERAWWVRVRVFSLLMGQPIMVQALTVFSFLSSQALLSSL